MCSPSIRVRTASSGYDAEVALVDYNDADKFLSTGMQ